MPADYPTRQHWAEALEARKKGGTALQDLIRKNREAREAASSKKMTAEPTSKPSTPQVKNSE